MEKYLVSLQTPCVYYDDDFLNSTEANDAYEYLLKNTKWEKTAKINRWVALHETRDLNSTVESDGYKYRDAPGAPQIGFNDTILEIKRRAEEWYQRHSGRSVEFNVCLLNFYEDGQQRIGWHSDREEIGRDTPIASVSLGATRSFLVRAKQDGVRDRVKLELSSGSMVLMENICQHLYLHSIPKQSEVTGGRINLTFRCKSGATAGEDEHERRDNWLSDIIDGAEPSMDAWVASETTETHVFGDGVSFGDVNQPIHFVVRTNLGAECYCAAEILEMLSTHFSCWTVVARPLGMDGFVACAAETTSDVIEKTSSFLLKLKSAHHVLMYHDHFDLIDLLHEQCTEPTSVDGESLYQFFKQRLIDGTASIKSLNELNEVGGSFRVTCSRIGGPHGFRAPDVEREIGGAMMEFYSKCIPKMEEYDVNVRVDVVGNMVIIGTQMNIHDLTMERHFLRFRNAVTIKVRLPETFAFEMRFESANHVQKANLAYAMVRCAAVKSGDHVVDPFCGSGTLLLEALEMFGRRIKCKGMDVSKRSTDGARENALAEGCGSDVCEFACTDARGLRRYLEDNSVDAMITNLPWGVMTGHKNVSDLQTMYEVFLRTSWYVLKDGARIVMLVLRGLQLTRIIRKLAGRYRLLNVNVVRTTNNLPCIIVIEKLGRDELRESVKGQLSYMSKYVNFSPEIYEAIHMETIDDEH